MISIDVGEIGSKIIEFNHIVDDYYLASLNLFNSINQLSGSWMGTDANMFFTCMEKEKLEVNELLAGIKDQWDIYKYIYEGYRQIGNQIKCNLDAKDEILGKINNCIEKAKEIKIIYQSIDITQNYDEKESIRKKEESVKKILNKYDKVKENIKNTYIKISEIEQEVNKKLENIDSLQIQELEIS